MGAKFLLVCLCVLGAWSLLVTPMEPWSPVINKILDKFFTRKSMQNNDILLIDSVAEGTQMAITECARIFKWERWNCPEAAFTKNFRKMRTRETAYTDAIVSAGIVHAITKKCAAGEIQDCECMDRENLDKLDPKKIVDLDGRKYAGIPWSWGGCSQNTHKGEDIVRRYIEKGKELTDVQSYVSRHNSQLGRRIIRRTMQKKCTCQGLSGSCAIRTCWLQLAPFPTVASHLKMQYMEASQVHFNLGNILLGNSLILSPAEAIPKKQHRRLLYINQSPNYCFGNNTIEWPGTKGRACSKEKTNVTEEEKHSCHHLCKRCGYTVHEERRIERIRCNCQYFHCCLVKCDNCTSLIQNFYCE